MSTKSGSGAKPAWVVAFGAVTRGSNPGERTLAIGGPRIPLLLALCIVVAVMGVLLILFGAIGPTAAYVPAGVPAGIALLVVGVVLYLILTLVVTTA